MIITEEKVRVTYDMMAAAGMTKLNTFGVPDGKDGLVWKPLIDLTENDYDKIEDFFIKRSVEHGRNHNVL